MPTAYIKGPKPLSPIPKLLYTSFDEVPGPKGASTHIEAFARAVGQRFASLVLVTPGPADVDVRPFAPGVRQIVLGCPDKNPIGRVRTFRAKLCELLERQPFDLIHFRSIFEGYLLRDPRLRRGARLLYEVNGFPSVEMKYHYRGVMDDELLTRKLIAQESACLRAANQIVTISDTTREYITQRDIPDRNISVIRNGVHIDEFPFHEPSPVGDGAIRIAYVGTLTAWQGIETLIEAVELVRKQRPIQLRLLGPVSRRRKADLQRLAARLHVEDCIQFLPSEERGNVCRLLHESHMSVVPLLAVDRNTRQGCCPLKLLESMAAGCPAIASDLPVVRELAQPERHYLPCRAGDARNLKNAILRLAADHALARRLARQARAHVSSNYRWQRATDRLIEVYEALLAGLCNSSVSSSASMARE